MSHIIKGTITVNYTNRDALKKAMGNVGKVEESTFIYRDNGSHYVKDNNSYELVLVSQDNKKHRIGFKLENGRYQPYYDDYGKLGTWIKGVVPKLDDYYIAHDAGLQLEQDAENDFSYTVEENQHGEVEMVAVSGGGW